MDNIEDIARELREIDALATEALGEDEKAKWFANDKIFSLNNEVPNDLLLTKDGRRRVRNILGGIIHGFPA